MFLAFGFEFSEIWNQMGDFECDCVIEFGYDVYGLMYGLFGVLSWFWSLGVSLGRFGRF